MEGMSFGDLMNAVAEPDTRWLPHRADQLLELRSDLGEDGGPLADPRLPEESGAARGRHRRLVILPRKFTEERDHRQHGTPPVGAHSEQTGPSPSPRDAEPDLPLRCPLQVVDCHL